MRRREFITLLYGGMATTWPLSVRSQSSMPVVGFMISGSRGPLRNAIAAFESGLKQEGFVDGQNLTIEYRFADGRFDRFPGFAAELIERHASVLVTTGSGAFAAKKATKTVPIVFSIGLDPVETGLVSSLNHPDGNLTGVYQFATGLEGKRLGLLHEMVPKASKIGVLINPNYPSAEAQIRDVTQASKNLALQVLIARANVEGELNDAISTLVAKGAEGLLVCASPFFNARREQLIVLATRHALPAIYEWRDFAEAGGLMSYGTDLAEAYRQAALYAGRVIKGAKPADLPIVEVTKFEFVINLNTAKALGIDVPPTLSARADDVIQ